MSRQKTNQSKNWIRVFGAREHNLKNINVEIPKEQLTVITGPSGSGKSSLALDILFTEGKRRYTESLSAYARQFLGVAKKPQVDRIEGLCPAIAIEQKTVGHNPRSTVGTITEIYDYLRVLFARIGKPYCPQCDIAIKQESPESISHMIYEKFSGHTITIAAPLAIEKKGEFQQELSRLFNQGYYRFLIDDQKYKFSHESEIQELKLRKTFKHTIHLVLDMIEVSDTEKSRIFEAVERAFKESRGSCTIISDEKTHIYSSSRACLVCAHAFPELEPRLFSFNSPLGACKDCHGLGIHNPWLSRETKNDSEWTTRFRSVAMGEYLGSRLNDHNCFGCRGQRLNKHALSVKINSKNIYDVGELSISQALSFFESIKLSESELQVAKEAINEVISRLKFLVNVGLSYLSLNRTARTLSGGEGQRIRLATQIGSSLSGVLYILDEPSIGLHQRDNDRLIETLKNLRDLGNTVLVVEHDIDTMRAADYIIDMGPEAGINGGMITSVGTPEQIAKDEKSVSGAFLSGKKKILLPDVIRKPIGHLILKEANKNNLKNIDVSFPLGVMCGISGVSGSGKSTLIMEELVPEIISIMGHASYNRSRKIEHKKRIIGLEQLDALVVIDQAPIGRTPRSNPATYLGIFDDIRALFASLPESNVRGYQIGRFSFNVSEGRCFECRGEGSKTVSMHFLPDVTMICNVCHGTRYNQQTLEIKYRDKSIADILAMTAWEAKTFFNAHKKITKRLELLCDVGLDYLKLGQSSTTLSGGEAQRIKLVDELSKRGNRTLYILDEPTTGLHNSDIIKLLEVLNRLINRGNSMIIIEHNLDVLKTADYLIDLGPEGGADGGYIIAQGTPDEVSRVSKSHTGQYLQKIFHEYSLRK